MKIIFVITLSCIACIFSNAQTLQVIPLQIRFNNDIYEHSNDALTISDDNGNTFELPEYSVYEDEWEDSRNNPFAYIMGQQSRTIDVLFADTSPNEYDGLAHLIVKLSVTNGNGIGTTCNIFIPNYYWVEHTIHLNSPLPNYVGKHEFTWKWEIYAIPVDEPGYSAGANTTYTTHTYYTLLDEPQAPMTEPWTSVLDYACEWASGQTTETHTVQKILEGLYNESGFKYDVVDGSSRYTGKTTHSFNLGYMISDLNSISSNIIVNCYDMGKAVDILASSLGCDTNYALSQPFGYLNCIKAIGRDWANNPFYEYNTEYSNPVFSSNPIVGEDDDYYDGRSSFSNHAFCELDSYIYDACLKVDTDSNPDAPPHSNSNNGGWAIGWSWGTYKNKVIDNNPSSSPPIETTIYTYEVF